MAAATLAQLNSLKLSAFGAAPIILGCLCALTGLQSLSLSGMPLAAPGLSLVAQGCSSLTQLLLCAISISAPLPNQPPLPPCIWPALLELQLNCVKAGLVSHVLPTPTAAPLLIRLAPFPEWPDSWPRGLQSSSLSWAVGGDQPGMAMAQLAADLRCLAACPVPCQALQLLCCRVPDTAALAAAVAMLAPTLTHLYLDRWREVGAQSLEELCMGLPQLRCLFLDHPRPTASGLLLHPSLCQLLGADLLA